MALVLLLASLAIFLVPVQVTPWACCGMLAAATLMALAGAVGLLRQALQCGEAKASTVKSTDPLMTLSTMLEGHQVQMHEAAAAVSRAVTAGAQLARLTHGAEQHRRQGEQSTATSTANPLAPLLEELRASITLAQETTAIERQVAEKALQHRLDGIDARLEAVTSALEAMPRSLSSMEVPPELPGSLARLDTVSRQLAVQAEERAHHEASLGDAARYLTEITDRLRNSTQVVETHAVRLQALIMVQNRVPNTFGETPE